MDPNEEIAQAVFAQAEVLGWSLTRVAATAGCTTNAARLWESRRGTMMAATFFRLLREMPGLQKRIFNNDESQVAAA